MQIESTPSTRWVPFSVGFGAVRFRLGLRLRLGLYIDTHFVLIHADMWAAGLSPSTHAHPHTQGVANTHMSIFGELASCIGQLPPKIGSCFCAFLSFLTPTWGVLDVGLCLGVAREHPVSLGPDLVLIFNRIERNLLAQIRWSVAHNQLRWPATQFIFLL